MPALRRGNSAVAWRAEDGRPYIEYLHSIDKMLHRAARGYHTLYRLADGGWVHCSDRSLMIELFREGVRDAYR